MKTRKPNQIIGLWSTSYKWTLTFYDRNGDIIDKQTIYIPITGIDDYIEEEYGYDHTIKTADDKTETMDYKIYVLQDKDYFLYRRIIAKIDFRREIPNLGSGF